MNILKTNYDAAVMSKSSLCREFHVLQWQQQWKQRRDLLKHRTVLLESAEGTTYLFFQSEKGQTAFQESLQCLLHELDLHMSHTHAHKHTLAMVNKCQLQ